MPRGSHTKCPPPHSVHSQHSNATLTAAHCVCAAGMCVQTSFDFATLDVSFHEDTGGPAGGLIMLTMIDVTVAERNKELVARRYELAYNEKAADSELIEFFASYVEESPKSVPVPGEQPTPASSLLTRAVCCCCCFFFSPHLTPFFPPRTP